MLDLHAGMKPSGSPAGKRKCARDTDWRANRDAIARKIPECAPLRDHQKERVLITAGQTSLSGDAPRRLPDWIFRQHDGIQLTPIGLRQNAPYG